MVVDNKVILRFIGRDYRLKAGEKYEIMLKDFRQKSGAFAAQIFYKGKDNRMHSFVCPYSNIKAFMYNWEVPRW